MLKLFLLFTGILREKKGRVSQCVRKNLNTIIVFLYARILITVEIMIQDV